MSHSSHRTSVLFIAMVMLVTFLLPAWSHRQMLPVSFAPFSGPDTTLVRRIRSEVALPTEKMTESSRPVQVRQLGRHLRVKSPSEQLLPVYTAQGSYYASFRLMKGTNWITGLPRGAYFINHRKYTIN